MSDLQQIPLPAIDFDFDVNPRTRVDAGALQPLADSIARLGVLQPIIVEATAEGRYRLIAGQRRYTAAGLAGLEEIPAVVRETNGDAAAVALVENLHREQLSPLEEARAFEKAIHGGLTPAELAKAVSLSPDTIKQRLSLLKLPERAQELVDDGSLTMAAAASLEKLQAAGPDVVAAAAEIIADQDNGWDEVTARDLEDRPGDVLDWALERLGEDAPALIAPAGWKKTLDPNHLVWPAGFDEKVVDELCARAKLIPEIVHAPKYSRPRSEALKCTTEDIDAARAYGCLVELEGLHGRERVWFADPVWLADRISQKLEKAIASWERKQKAAAKKAAKDAGIDASQDPEKALREAKRAENAAQLQTMLSARERNLSLGHALFKELHAPAVTVDGMRAVALLLIDYAGADLGRAGWRLVDETVQTVTTRKDGSISRVTYPRSMDECRQLLRRRVEKARTAEEILGVLLQAFVAARFAETDALPKNDRYSSLHGLAGWSPDRDLIALVETISEPLLPGDVAQAIRDRREAEAATRERENEEAVA